MDEQPKQTQTQTNTQPEQPTAQTGQKTNGLAITALVIGICGILFLWVIGPIVALILGLVALNQIKKQPQQGKGMAIAGVILGALGLLFSLIFIVFIGGLAYFGVMNADNFIPERCVAYEGFSCVSYAATDAGDHTQITFRLQNNRGEDLSNLNIGYSSPNCLFNNNVNYGALANGDSIDVTLDCDQDYLMNDRIMLDLDIGYTSDGSTLERSTYGQLRAVVG